MDKGKNEFGMFSASPAIWGRITWNILHTISMNLEESDLNEFKKLLTSLRDLLPCINCRIHYNKFMEKVNLDNMGINELQTLLFDLHNDVNKRKKTKIFEKDVLDSFKNINKENFINFVIKITFCIYFTSPMGGPKYNSHVLNLETYEKRMEFINKIQDIKVKRELSNIYGSKVLYDLGKLELNERKKKINELVNEEKEKKDKILFNKYNSFLKITNMNLTHDQYINRIFWLAKKQKNIEDYFFSINYFVSKMIGKQVDTFLDEIPEKDVFYDCILYMVKQIKPEFTFDGLLKTINQNLLLSQYELHTTVKDNEENIFEMIKSFRKHFSPSMLIHIHHEKTASNDFLNKLKNVGSHFLIKEEKPININFKENYNNFGIKVRNERKKLFYISSNVTFDNKPVKLIDDLIYNKNKLFILDA